MKKNTNSNVMVIATLKVIFHVKNSKRKYEDKATYGFIASSFTAEDKKEMSKIIIKGMDEKMKEHYGERIEKELSKLEYRVSYQVTKVDFIIGEKEK